jgi:hypothetical protein
LFDLFLLRFLAILFLLLIALDILLVLFFRWPITQ